MRPGQRFGLSAIEKRDVWSRWKAGQSLHEIGRAFDKPHSCIRAVLLPRGGIPPAARRRSRLALTLAEREDISRGIASGLSIREIGRHLDRVASTVRRPSGSRPLGRGSAGRCQEHLHCDSGGAPFALCHADQGAQQEHGNGRCCIESACSQTPRYPATLADLGSRTRDGQAQGLHGSDGCAGLLL